MHEKYIVHRDIKPENIMIHDNQIKIGDFGCATFIRNRMHETFCGTLDYLSPEMINKKQYDFSISSISLLISPISFSTILFVVLISGWNNVL